MPLIFPPPHLCTGSSSLLPPLFLSVSFGANPSHLADNAAMIAQVGLSRLRRGRIDPLTVGLRAKWSIEECEKDFEEGPSGSE